MLKQLLKYTIAGLLSFFVIISWNIWTMAPAEQRVTARHDAPPPEANLVTTETEAVAQDRKETTSVAPVSRKRFHPVSNRDSEAELRFPVAGYTTSAVISFFGDKRGKSRLHKGVDIKAPRHTPVVAVVDGFVEKISESGSGGKALYLRAGDGRLYFYAHLEDWSVNEFESVREGQELGTVGDSGNAKGTTPHLHFEVMEGKKKVSLDPYPLLSTEE